MQSEILTIDGKEYGLLLNGTALFDLADRFDNRELHKVIYGSGKSGLDDLAEVIAAMSEQYAAAREYEGAERPIAIDAQKMRAYLAAPTVQPYEFSEIRDAVMRAAMKGFKRTVPKEGEVDLVLQEFEKKSKKAKKEPVTSASD